MRRLISIGLSLGAAGLLAAGCTAGASSSSNPSSSGSGSSTASATSTTMVLDNENGGPWTCGFNPYQQAVNFLSVGFTYEPLVYVNPLQGGKETPMLASSYSWSSDHTSLTFQIRQGVKWSDGQPLTAADVAYTFNLLKPSGSGGNPMDIDGIWSVISSVSSTADSVTLHLTSPALAFFYYIADLTPIIPEHVWSKIAKPATDTVGPAEAIGSGPYVISKCTPQNITYKANPYFWQPGLPKVKTLQYPAYLDNNTANNDLANGNAQWGSQYIPGIQQFYLSKSQNYHYWFPPTVNVSIVPNLTDSRLKDVKVRQAISYALNRTQISSIGESGYEPPANQTGVVTPTFNQFQNPAAVAALGQGYDVPKAKSLLASDGYHLGPDGVMVNASGQKLSFHLIVNGGFSDWVASMQVAQQQLKAVGIQITPQNMNPNTFATNLQNGHYELAVYDQQIFGPSPWFELNNWLNSAATAPIGQAAGTNYERYKNAATDTLLKQYITAVTPDAQQSILNQLQMVMVNQVPVIPVYEAVDWFQYDSGKLNGWPSASDPYAQPAIYAYPDNEQVLLHLSPAS